MNKMSSPPLYFIAFVIFLLCQYAIWVVSNFISHYFGLTGKVYWCVVLVSFLILNEFAFGSYEFAMNTISDDDELQDEWGE